MKSDPLKKRIRVSHFGNMNYLGNTMFSKSRPAPILLLLALVLSFSLPAFAQKIKIKKVKGNSALIESTLPLEEGKIYDLDSAPVAASVDYSNQGFKSRQNSFTLGLNFSSFNSSVIQKTIFSVQGRYGWNFSFLELGLVSQVSYLDQGAGGQTDFSGGGYFDYNLISNRDSRSFIYGPFTMLMLGSTQKNGGSASLVDLNAGGFFSFFSNQSTTALRIEGFADFQQVTAATQATNLSGFGGRALLLFYF